LCIDLVTLAFMSCTCKVMRTAVLAAAKLRLASACFGIIPYAGGVQTSGRDPAECADHNGQAD
jgi:hypothetical protein